MINLKEQRFSKPIAEKAQRLKDAEIIIALVVKVTSNTSGKVYRVIVEHTAERRPTGLVECHCEAGLRDVPCSHAVRAYALCSNLDR
jgi:hypothetical protein